MSADQYPNILINQSGNEVIAQTEAGVFLIVLACFLMPSVKNQEDSRNTYYQCFESVSGSMWIRIEMAPLDPDPDPYWEYGSRSGSRTVKMVSKKGKNLRFQVKKSIDHFVDGLMILI